MNDLHFDNSMKFPRHFTFGYSPIPDDMEFPQTKSLSIRIACACRQLLLPLIAVLSVCIGVIIGATVLNPSPSCKNQMIHHPASGQPFVEDMAFRFLTRTFSYNRTFGADPREDNLTNDAWESIVPGGIPMLHSSYFLYNANMKVLVGQGSVRLSGSPQVYTLSVIHQLHCLVSHIHSQISPST